MKIFYNANEKDEFYKRLEEVRSQAVSTHHKYCGDYSQFTYWLENGDKWKLLINDELGIPSYLEQAVKRGRVILCGGF